MRLNLFTPDKASEVTKFVESLKTAETIKIVTHGGIMHADDVLAVAFIKAYYIAFSKVRKFEVIRCERTQKPEDIEGKHFVVDLGNRDEFDGQTLWLDHHQLESGMYENGVKLAACGKIFDVLNSMDDDVTEYIRTKLLYPVEAADNGQTIDDIGEHKLNWVKNFNPTFDESEYNADTMFDLAVIMATQVYARILKEALSHRSAKTVFVDALIRMKDNPEFHNVLFLDKPIPWQDFYFNNLDRCELARYVVFKDTISNEGYVIRTLPKEQNSFEVKFNLPYDWYGLRGEELAKKSGIDGAIFCHKTGFMAKWDTFEHTMEAVHKAIDELTMMPCE